MRRAIHIIFLAVVFSFTASGCNQTVSSTPPSEKPAPPAPGDHKTGVSPGNTDELTKSADAQSKSAPGSGDSQGGTNPEEEAVAEAATPPPLPLFEYPDAVRGIYVTAHSAGGSRFADLVKLVDDSDLNAMVVDIKDDYGYITYKMEGPLEQYSKPYIKDPKELIRILSEHEIYPIARIVVFKDSVLAGIHPELSFQNGGQIWKNGRGEAFVNPFMRKVWEHNLAIAKKAAELGFQEIQFDYVRFPEGFEKRDKTLSYSMGDYTKEKLEPRLMREWEVAKAEWDKQAKEAWAAQQESTPPAQAVEGAGQAEPSKAASAESAVDPSITLQRGNQNEVVSLPAEPPKPEYNSVAARVTAVTDFVRFAKKELEPYKVKVSVDIFGYTATLPEAPGIGQNFTYISQNVDVISSMIYPSHWGQGYFNISKPDVEPYRLVQEYAKMEKEKLAQMKQSPISRPWIQDFTASWLGKGNYIPYGKAEVEGQIQALNEAGIKEFLLWNAGNSYSPGVDYTPLN